MCEPINPAPPVTKIFICTGVLQLMFPHAKVPFVKVQKALRGINETLLSLVISEGSARQNAYDSLHSTAGPKVFQPLQVIPERIFAQCLG